ncbi:MAG: hypothetical protein D6690_16210 [Nitrospirae bacterium]|nr:MAG: hypothetical protein D6690_16210 [Nitrospirota bacterium]
MTVRGSKLIARNDWLLPPVPMKWQLILVAVTLRMSSSQLSEQQTLQNSVFVFSSRRRILARKARDMLE